MMRGSVVGAAAVMVLAIGGMGALAWSAFSGPKHKPVKVTTETPDGPTSKPDGTRPGRKPTVGEPAGAPKAPHVGVGVNDTDDADDANGGRDPRAAPGATTGPNGRHARASGASGTPGPDGDPFNVDPGQRFAGAVASAMSGSVPGIPGAFPMQGDAGSACPAAMVDVGGYCIDAMEVTNNSYRAFLDARPNRRMQPAECSWNLDYTPTYGAPPADTRPVVGVDWCDAWLYCAWSGKRLCGAIGGGPASPGAFADSSRNEWFNVCTNSGATAFSYGDTFDESKCAHSADDGALAPVGSYPQCIGNTPPFDGVFDMSGNAWEWENSCAGMAGEKDVCRIRGGGTHASSAIVSCSMDYLARRDQTFKTVGIRCCAARKP